MGSYINDVSEKHVRECEITEIFQDVMTIQGQKCLPVRCLGGPKNKLAVYQADMLVPSPSSVLPLHLGPIHLPSRYHVHLPPPDPPGQHARYQALQLGDPFGPLYLLRLLDHRWQVDS